MADTWHTGDTIPGNVLEVHGDNLHWRRCTVTDWWTARTPERELLYLPTEALLECCGTVSVHAEAVTA